MHQAPVIASMGRTALTALYRRVTQQSAQAQIPGPEFCTTIAPRSKALLKAYVRHTGGDPSAYRRTLPPHLFPQWGFALAARTLTDVDYPLQKVLNAGCRMEQNAPLPNDQPLNVRVRLESIDDNGRRAIIRQRVITETDALPNALVAYMTVLGPLSKGPREKGKSRKEQSKEKPRVPAAARELSYLRLSADAGLSFAKLTGDFNPVHWLTPYAKAFGFRNCILHGFGTMARAYEAIARGVLCGRAHSVKMLDVSFTRPLVLPARVGVYVTGERELFVGDGPGGGAYLTGHYELAIPH